MTPAAAPIATTALDELAPLESIGLVHDVVTQSVDRPAHQHAKFAISAP